MDLETRIAEAVVSELKRQASSPERKLSVEQAAAPDILINGGRIDLDKLAMVIAGTLSGGP